MIVVFLPLPNSLIIAAPHYCFPVGMVRETGEATERFLRSMAAGDADATEALQQAAAAGLAAISSCTAAASAQGHLALGPLSSQLLERAQQLNKQMASVLRAIRNLPGGTGVTTDVTSGVTSDLTGAGIGGQGVASAAGSATGAVVLQGSPEATAALHQLQQVMEATEQLQHMAVQLVQQLTAAATITGTAAADDDGSDEGDESSLAAARVPSSFRDVVGGGPGASPFLRGPDADDAAAPGG